MSKTIQAVVDEDQLSLAIGRNGQNVRLASELTGWKIDLYSSREWLEKGGDEQLFAPLPGERESDEAADVPLDRARRDASGHGGRAQRGGLSHAQRHHRPRARGLPALAGIAPEEADRIIALLDELTTEDAGATGGAVGEARRRRRRVNTRRRGPSHLACFRLVGLGVRGRGAIVGVEQVRESREEEQGGLRRRRIRRVRHSLDKVVPLLNARRVRFVEVPSAAELGAAVGRETDGRRWHRRSAAREGNSRAGGVGLGESPIGGWCEQASRT